MSNERLPSYYQELDKNEATPAPEKQCDLVPMPGRCVFQKEKAATKAGAIYIPKTAQRTPTIGRVLAVGDTEREYLVGKRMIIGHMSGVPIYIQGAPAYSICAYEELLCEVKSEEEIKFEPEDTSLMYQ